MKGRYWELEIRLGKKEVWKFYVKKKSKMFIYESKLEVNEQFGRKKIQDVDGNRKFAF